MKFVHPFPAKPLRVIHVSGDDYQIGRGHWEATREDFLGGMGSFFFQFWKRQVETPKTTRSGKLIHRIVTPFLHKTVIPRLCKQVPFGILERIRGMHEASGQPTEELLTALVLPDLFPLLQTLLVRFRPEVFVTSQFPGFGCSSFLNVGKQFLIGRNLDFPGVGFWDRYPVIQCTVPKKGLRYIGFTTASVPYGGITGINEAKIYVGLHQHYCRFANWKGILPFVIGEEILLNARNLLEAKKIIQKYRVASSWAFVLADGKTREGMIIETNSNTHGVRSLSENRSLLTHSNYYQTPECAPSEFATGARMNWDNHARNDQLLALVKKAGSSLTPEQSAKALSDHYDPYWKEEKIVNRTVSQLYNIQSLVLNPENMRVWIAQGNAPIHLREYHAFDLAEIFSGRSGQQNSSLSGYRFQDPKKAEAKEIYTVAFIHAMNGNYVDSEILIEDSLASDFHLEGALTLSVLRLKRRDYASALEGLLLVKEVCEKKMSGVGRTQPPPEYFETLIYIARVLDLLGRRSEALHYYRLVEDHRGLQDSNLRRIAHSRGPYTQGHLRNILAPFASYVPFQ